MIPIVYDEMWYFKMRDDLLSKGCLIIKIRSKHMQMLNTIDAVQKNDFKKLNHCK